MVHSLCCMFISSPYCSFIQVFIDASYAPNMLSGSVQLSPVTYLCPTLCNPMDCGMPGFPVHHQLPELAQTRIHRVRDAIKLSHPLLSPSPPAFNLFQHQGLFQ